MNGGNRSLGAVAVKHAGVRTLWKWGLPRVARMVGSRLFWIGHSRVRSRVVDGNGFIMAVKIRLKRIGAKNHPVYRVVVADGRSPRDGRFIEELGTYDPLRQGRENYTLDFERASYWLSKGAQPSETVASLIKRAGKAQPRTAVEPVAG